jgi:hypothetical protein
MCIGEPGSLGDLLVIPSAHKRVPDDTPGFSELEFLTLRVNEVTEAVEAISIMISLHSR